jgi:hypothetical protein
VGTRVTWQDLWFVEETADIDSRSSFLATGVGVGDGIFRALVRPTPAISYPNRIKFAPRSSGFAEPYSGDLIESINSLSNVSYSFNLDSYLLSLFGKCLFHGGTQTSPAGGVYRYVMVPYTSPTPANYISTVRATPDAWTDAVSVDRSSHELWGALVTSISIDGSAGGLMNLTVNLSGARYNRTNILGEISNDPRLTIKYGNAGTVPTSPAILRETSYGSFSTLDASASNVADDDSFTDPDSLGAGSVEISNSTGNLNFSSSDISSYSGQNITVNYASGNRVNAYTTFDTTITSPPNPLRFQDATILIDGSSVACNDLSFSVKTQIEPKYYDERDCYDIFLGRTNGSLTLNIPFGDTNYGSAEAFYNYMGENIHYVQIYWGTSNPIAENEVALRLNGKVKSPSFSDSGGELLSNVQFELMADQSNESVELVAAYSSSKLDRS